MHSRQSLAATFVDIATQAPQRLAVWNGDHALTYGELLARATQVARALRQRDILPDAPVGLAMPRSLDSVTAVLGAPISGGIANARSDRWGAVIELSGTTFGIDFTIPPPPTVRQFPLGALPRGTYTGWNLRSPQAGAETMLSPLDGMYIPFAKTKAEREKTGDPRLSLEERYPTREAYLARIEKAAKKLQEEGFLLEEDVARIIERASAP